MALLDTITRFASEIEISDYPVIGQSMSAGGRITAVQARPRIWTFRMAVETPALRYQDYTVFLEQLRSTNMSQPFEFTVANTPGLWFRTPYQGTMTPGQQAAVRVAARQSGDAPNVLRLSGLPLAQSDVITIGDFIQVIDTNQRVYTSTQNITASATGTASVVLSDALAQYPAVNSTVNFGPNVVWSNCYFSELPNPVHQSVFQGGITWSGDFRWTQSV